MTFIQAKKSLCVLVVPAIHCFVEPLPSWCLSSCGFVSLLQYSAAVSSDQSCVFHHSSASHIGLCRCNYDCYRHFATFNGSAILPTNPQSAVWQYILTLLHSLLRSFLQHEKRNPGLPKKFRKNVNGTRSFHQRIGIHLSAAFENRLFDIWFTWKQLKPRWESTDSIT